MTKEEVYKLNILNKDGIFTPKTECTIVEKNVDGEIIRTFDYTIVQSAEDYYQEWIDNKNNPPKPKESTEVEILQKQLLETQNMLVELQYKLTNKALQSK